MLLVSDRLTYLSAANMNVFAFYWKLLLKIKLSAKCKRISDGKLHGLGLVAIGCI